MNKNRLHLCGKILNWAFAYGGLNIIFSFLPHWENINLHVYINNNLNFILFLLATSILLKGKANRDIFFNLSLFFLVGTLSFTNIYIGKNYIFGDDYLMYRVFTYTRILLSILFCFSILYICIKYLFSNFKTWMVYSITSMLILAIFLHHFFPYFTDKYYIFRLGANYDSDFCRRVFLCYSLPFISTIFYGYVLLKKDKLNGTFMNAIMASLFLYLITSMVNALSRIYSFNIFSIQQFFITANLLFLSILLFNKLYFICSEYGQLYENILIDNGKLGNVKIVRHRANTKSLLLKFFVHYIFIRRNYLLFICFITGIIIFYLRPPKYLLITVSSWILCFLILIIFINALYRRRARQKFIIS